MTDQPQQQPHNQGHDAPDMIKSNPNLALKELYGLSKSDPGEFRREVDLINKTTDLSFLANGKQDMQIVGFEPSAFNGGTNRLVMQNRHDHSFLETNHSAEGVRLPDASSADTVVGNGRAGRVGGDAYATGQAPAYRDYQPAAYGDRQPQGVAPGAEQGARYDDPNRPVIQQGANDYDFNYPGGRHIHIDLAQDRTPMRFTEGTHTYDRQIINGQPSHLWIDQSNPNNRRNMEIQFNRADGSLNLRYGDTNGNVVGSSTYTVDGSKIDITGDVRNGQAGAIRAITTPAGRYLEFPPGGQMQGMAQSFKDENGALWRSAGGGAFVDGHNRKRNDVIPMPGGTVMVRQGNAMVTYAPNGTVSGYVPQRR